MAQEINDQEQAEKNTAEKPKGSRRTGSRKKAATAQESPADAAVVSPSQGEDKPKSVRRTRKSTKAADTAQNPDGEATASPKKTDSPVGTAEVSPAVHGEEQTSETDAPAKPRRTRSKNLNRRGRSFRGEGQARFHCRQRRSAPSCISGRGKQIRQGKRTQKNHTPQIFQKKRDSGQLRDFRNGNCNSG